jgi:hypothetical protein
MAKSVRSRWSPPLIKQRANHHQPFLPSTRSTPRAHDSPHRSRLSQRRAAPLPERDSPCPHRRVVPVHRVACPPSCTRYTTATPPAHAPPPLCSYVSTYAPYARARRSACRPAGGCVVKPRSPWPSSPHGLLLNDVSNSDSSNSWPCFVNFLEEPVVDRGQSHEILI